jgi:hypothetical protein
MYSTPRKKIQLPFRQNIRAVLNFVDKLEHSPNLPRYFQRWYICRAAFTSSMRHFHIFDTPLSHPRALCYKADESADESKK